MDTTHRCLFFVLLLVLPSILQAQTLSVANEAQLREAIFDLRGSTPASTIQLTGDVLLSQSLPMISASTPLVIDGNGHVLDADNKGRAFFVVSGIVTIQNVIINNALAKGGKGGDGIIKEFTNPVGMTTGAGGGLGAGAAIFVNSGAGVTLENVTFGNAAAQGGDGGSGGVVNITYDGNPGGTNSTGGGPGGGGLGGDGGNGSRFGGGGGGGYAGRGGTGNYASGGGGGEFGNGGRGETGGGGGGGTTTNGGNASTANPGAPGGEANGGNGGSFASAPGPGFNAGGLGGGGGGAAASSTAAGGAGGIGGGGGGGSFPGAGRGGDFGGGGGGASGPGPAGSSLFGGGSGGNYYGDWSSSVPGGFGGGGGGGATGGSGGSYGGAGGSGQNADGGGGAALGGAVFVRSGGALTLTDSTFSGTYSATPGTTGGMGGATAGQALGALGFLMSGATMNMDVNSLELATLSEVLAGSGSLVKSGEGTLVISAAHTYTGTTTITGGRLELSAPGGVAGAIDINAGGMLAGNGQADEISLRSGGTLGGGLLSTATGGTITAASLQWEAGGSLLAVAGPNSSPVVHLDGALDKSGTGLFTIDLIDAGAVGGQTYELIQADGGITGFQAGDFTVTGLAGQVAIAADAVTFTVSVPPRHDVKMTTTRGKKRAAFTITNTGNTTSSFSLRKTTNITSDHRGPKPTNPPKKSRIKITYTLNGREITRALKNRTASTTLAAGATARVVVKAGLRGVKKLAFKRTIRVLLTATSQADVSKSAIGKATLVMKDTR